MWFALRRLASIPNTSFPLVFGSFAGGWPGSPLLPAAAFHAGRFTAAVAALAMILLRSASTAWFHHSSIVALFVQESAPLSKPENNAPPICLTSHHREGVYD